MRNALFITIEGPDGAGKSTQIANIEKYFQDKGMEYIVTREPGGTKIGEMIREIILDKNNAEMDDLTEAMLYAASRAQHVAQIIKPALEEGKVVICDRFIDSSIAYQGYGRGLGDAVLDINKYAVEGFMPDLTFVINIDPSFAKTRIKKGTEDRVELEADDFHKEVFRGYVELEKQFPERIKAIDGSKTKEDICKQIYDILDKYVVK
ncbi:MAG: dTMP kinase [Clostridia bacterium]|nr:dTMP kinase [Clostridia bacterium]